MIFFHEKSSAQDRTLNSPYGLRRSFFLNRLTNQRVKSLVFLRQLAYAATTRFFTLALRCMQQKYSFFSKKREIKRVKTILQKVKYDDIENTKCEFRGCFYNLVVKVGYFFRKIIKRSPENAILVKKYEILDFGGSFDKSSGFYR